MAGVLLAGLVILFPVTSAEAQDDDTCAFQDLFGARAATTLTVDGDDRTYPRLTATTEYEIPLAGPGATALLGRTGDKEYEAALWCFLARWPLDQLAPAGEYRQQPPVVRIEEATPAANGKEATPERIVLLDEVTGDLTSRTVPPLLGPWAVTLDSNHLQLRLINKDIKDYEKWRPRAFNSMTWTARIKLSGLRFHQLEPKPVFTDDERGALWEPLAGDKSGVIRASVNLDVPTRMAIASGSGALDAASHASLALVNAFFYVTLLVLLFRYRKIFAVADSAACDKWRFRSGVSAACWIPVLGIASGVFAAAAYWWYGKENYLGREITGFTGLGIPIAYWKWSGLICICAVGLIILFLSYRERRALAEVPQWVPRVPFILFGLIPIFYGIIVLTSPELFKLNNDFSPIFRQAESGKDYIGDKDNIIAGGGQLVLMMLFTCAVLFVTITVLHFTFWSIRLASASDVAEKRYSLPPLWKLLVPSFVVSSVLTLQWVSQQVELWNRNNLFPAFDGDRRSQLIAEVAGRMVTYYVDLFAELTMNAVPWAAIAAIVFTLFRRGRGATSLRPSTGEYRLLGLLFAAVVATTTGSLYVGFAVPITFAVAFIIVGFILPGIRRFNLLDIILKTISVRHGDVQKQRAERELPEMLSEPTDLRGQLIFQQEDMDQLRDQTRDPVADPNSGNMKLRTWECEREGIKSSLAESTFPPASVTLAADWRVPLPPNVRPTEVALAIGPDKGWWDIGLRAAKIVAVPSILAMAYFSYIEYIKIEDGGVSWFNSYLGLLRLLESMVWEVGFWVAAAFVLGCLWRTLPGRRGPMKGAVLWAGFAIPSAIDFALGRGLLHQDRVDGVLMHTSLLLLELLLVGLMLDWVTLRDVTSRIPTQQSLATLYGLRAVGPALSTLGVVVVPLLLTVIGIYIQLTSGSPASDTPQVPGPPPAPGTGGSPPPAPVTGVRR